MGLPRWVGRAVGLDVHRDFCVVASCEAIAPAAGPSPIPRAQTYGSPLPRLAAIALSVATLNAALVQRRHFSMPRGCGFPGADARDSDRRAGSPARLL